MRYRKKPVVIEAIQFNGSNQLEVVNFIKGTALEEDFSSEDIVIETLEGNMTVSPNDFVIKGIKGEFYPCKPDIFEATYERVEE